MHTSPYTAPSRPLSRSDADIAGSVQVLLGWSPGLPRGSVKIAVEAGWVTLSGKADLAFARADLAASIRHVMGVAGVSDTIAS